MGTLSTQQLQEVAAVSRHESVLRAVTLCGTQDVTLGCQQLARFLFLRANYGDENHLMASPTVELYWRELVFDTRGYAQVCFFLTKTREVIHNDPARSQDPLPFRVHRYEETLRLYQQLFGQAPPPDFWPAQYSEQDWGFADNESSDSDRLSDQERDEPVDYFDDDRQVRNRKNIAAQYLDEIIALPIQEILEREEQQGFNEEEGDEFVVNEEQDGDLYEASYEGEEFTEEDQEEGEEEDTVLQKDNAAQDGDDEDVPDLEEIFDDDEDEQDESSNEPLIKLYVLGLPSPPDQPHEFTCRLTNTVRALKHLIREAQSVPVYLQVLSFEGHILDDDSLLADTGVTENATLQLTINSPGTVQLAVKTVTGKVMHIKVQPEYTIKQVKEVIAEEHGIQIAHQRLVFSGKQMLNNRTLKDYNITESVTIFLILKASS